MNRTSQNTPDESSRKTLSPGLKSLSVGVIAGLVLCGFTSTVRASEADANVPPQPSTTQLGRLTLADAEQHAIQNHPRLAAEGLRAQASGKDIAERRSGYFPQLAGNLTAAQANGDTAVAAGAVTTSSVSTRVAGGFSLSQLVTDFGRTHELVQSARYSADAAKQHTADVKQHLLLDVDQSYFAVGAAESVRKTAQAVLDYRQTSLRQLNALAMNQLRSTLDVQFAQVLVSEAEMAVVRADSNVRQSRAQLDAAMGYESEPDYVLTDEAMPSNLEPEVSTYIQEAIATRPDLKALRLQVKSSHEYATAEKKQNYPSINLIGTAGEVPVHDSTLHQEYGAAAINIRVPVLNGGLYSAEASQARLRAQADERDEEGLSLLIARDVRVNWARAQDAYLQIQVAQKLLDQTNVALRLAQARYDAGLGSIVELNEAELTQTSALIDSASAKFNYLSARAALSYAVGTLQ